VVGPTNCDDPVVGITKVFDPNEVRVIHLDCWDVPNVFDDRAKLPGLSFSLFVEEIFACREPGMKAIGTLLSAFFLASLYLRDLFVQFVEVHIGENRADHASHNVANFGRLFRKERVV
jgi:hypothetical protein